MGMCLTGNEHPHWGWALLGTGKSFSGNAHDMPIRNVHSLYWLVFGLAQGLSESKCAGFIYVIPCPQQKDDANWPQAGMNLGTTDHVQCYFSISGFEASGACDSWRSNNSDRETCNAWAVNFDLHALGRPASQRLLREVACTAFERRSEGNRSNWIRWHRRATTWIRRNLLPTKLCWLTNWCKDASDS